MESLSILKGVHMSYLNINVGVSSIIDKLPNKLILEHTTQFDPTLEQLNSAGYREIISVDQPEEGYRVGEYGFEELSGSTCKLTIISQINIAEEEAEKEAQRIEAERLRQLNKPLALKKVENNFLLFCEMLTGSRNKLGFEEITTILNNMLVSDPNTAIVLSLKMLGINSEGLREGGNLWWDDAKYHEELE